MLTCRDLLEGFRVGIFPWPWTNTTCRKPPPLKKPQFSFFNFISSLSNNSDDEQMLLPHPWITTQYTKTRQQTEFPTHVLLNLSGNFLWVFSSMRRVSRLMNSVLKTHSSRLSYSCSCRIMKSSCIVLKRTSRTSTARKKRESLFLWGFWGGDAQTLETIFHVSMPTQRGLTSEERGQPVPVSHTGILCSSPWREASWTSFCPYCATWSILPRWFKCHMLTLTLQLFTVSSNDNKGPEHLSAPFIFLSFAVNENDCDRVLFQ